MSNVDGSDAVGLRLHCVFARAEKNLDAQALLEPFFDRQEIQHVDFIHLAVTVVNERGNGIAQIRQRVHLHASHFLAKRRPLEQAQARIDGRRVERVDSYVLIDVRECLCVELPSKRNQSHRQAVTNVPVARVQRIRQRGACRQVLQAQVKQFRAIGAQAHFDVAQGPAPRKPRKETVNLKRSAQLKVRMPVPSRCRSMIHAKVFREINSTTCTNSALPMFMHHPRSSEPESTSDDQIKIQFVDTHEPPQNPRRCCLSSRCGIIKPDLTDGAIR